MLERTVLIMSVLTRPKKNQTGASSLNNAKIMEADSVAWM